jgi:hypothetical protein
VTFADGPLTGVLASCAAIAGAGLVLGGIAAGMIGVLRSWESTTLDFRVRKAGYWGAMFALLALVVEELNG